MPLAKTAKIDLENLRVGGYTPTDEEVIQLNDLAVRIERGKDTTPANAPRIAFAGDVVLHEPTVGSIEWWNNYGKDACGSDRMRLMTHYYMLAYANRPDVLNETQHPKDISKAVKKWMKNLGATEDELWRALIWVKYGDKDMPTDDPNHDAIQTTLQSEDEMKTLWMTLISACGAMGMTPDKLKTNTTSELIGMLIESNKHAHIPMKQSVAQDYMAYQMIIRTIEDRGKNNE